MPLLVRYCLSSVASVFLVATGIWLFVLNLLFFLREFLDYLFKYQAGFGNCLRLLLYIQPSFLVLVIPIGFLTALLVAYTRFSADREAMALESAGFSVSILLWPMMGLAFFLSVFLVLFMDRVLPWGNTSFIKLNGRILAERSAILVRERVLIPDFDGFLLYVGDKDDKRDLLKRVTVLFLDATHHPYRLIHAQEGTLRQDPGTFHEFLDLGEGVLQQVGTGSRIFADQFLQMKFKGCLLDLTARKGPPGPVNFQDARNISISELSQRLQEERKAGSVSRYDELEFQKKFSLPFSALAFAFIGIPLGLLIRSGHILGPVLAVVLVAIYDGFVLFAQESGPVGLVTPWVACWLPNAVLMFIGLGLVYWIYHRVGFWPKFLKRPKAVPEP
ncbi:MAG TPA: LptF/LptG family permease [bacterium]|nr:LptF/LptG family permease [bacterium]